MVVALPPPKLDTRFNENGMIFLATAILLVAAVFWTGRGPLSEKTDFTFTYLGACLVHQGDGSRLYDLGEQRRVVKSLFKRPNPLIYEHPPFEAAAFAPLAPLPYRTAYLIWGVTNVLIWLLAVYLIRPYASVPRSQPAYLAAWIFFAPLCVALYQGQTSLALLLLYVLTFINLKRGRDLVAGMCLGLGLFKFQFVLPFALIFLLRSKWRFLSGFAISAAMLGGLSFVPCGWRGVLSYLQLLVQISRHPANVSYGSAVDMPTVQGFVYAILGRQASFVVVSCIVAAISVLLILFAAWRWRQEDRKLQSSSSSELMFAGAVVVSLMTGFHMFTHDFSPLMLAILLVVARLPGKDRPVLRLMLKITLQVFWIWPLYFVLVAWHCLYLMFPVLTVFALATLRLAANPSEGVLMEAQGAPVA